MFAPIPKPPIIFRPFVFFKQLNEKKQPQPFAYIAFPLFQ